MNCLIPFKTFPSVREATLLAPLGVVWKFLVWCFGRRCNVFKKKSFFFFLKPYLNLTSCSPELGKAAVWPEHMPERPQTFKISCSDHAYGSRLCFELGLCRTEPFCPPRYGWTGACPKETAWAAGLSGVRRVPENPECQVQAHRCSERGMASIQPWLRAQN